MTPCDCVEGCQLADRFTPATREILVFTKSKKRYFDLDAVREPASREGFTTRDDRMRTDRTHDDGYKPERVAIPSSAPPLDWWNLPWDRVHDRLVRAMVPEKVCKVCGEPSRRIVEYGYADDPKRPGPRGGVGGGRGIGSLQENQNGINNPANRQMVVVPKTLGFSDCRHGDWRPGVVLDPFQPGDEMTATFYVGDAIETMNKLPEKSVDLILTSPPFLALRSYLPADHPDKALEGGSQATPGVYIDWLIDVVEACDRVLAPHGSLCIELGDTYAGSGGAGGDYDPGGWREGQEAFEGSGKRYIDSKYERIQYGDKGPPIANLHGKKQGGGSGWPLAKSLSLIPELFRLTLVYGTNPLTGRQTERWRLRNVVRWVRPNPPVGALGDKFRPATSELMVFCKSAKRYFDLDSVREPARMVMGRNVPGNNIKGSDDRSFRFAERVDSNPAGAPPLDWWNIPPGGYEGAHYAVFPPELCIKPIKAMCPEKVCRQCGEPSRRITEQVEEYDRDLVLHRSVQRRDGNAGRLTVPSATIRGANNITTGFSDCGHDDWRPGLVLDPFGGSGTTALVATGHGRDCILIDLDERNYELALQRVGPFILERAS